MFRFDESDPRYLVVYTGTTHPEPSDYRALMEHWLTWTTRGTRFGVILITEPHTHEPHEDMDAHREDEAEIATLINDFRHAHRETANRWTTGFARIADEDEMRPYVEAIPGGLAQIRAQQERFARYSFGVRGNIGYKLDEAKAWLDSIVSLPPLPLDDAAAQLTGRVGLFFGSTTGVTEYIADEIADAWGEAGLEKLSPVNIGSLKSLEPMTAFDYLIVGIPTWNIGQLQDDWEIMLPQLDDLDFSGRLVALFGVGDQYGYPDNFLDAMGMLGDKLEERGAKLVGFTDASPYEFSESLAHRDGKFIGLGIDDVGEPNLTAGRITSWVQQVAGEFALQPA